MNKLKSLVEPTNHDTSVNVRGKRISSLLSRNPKKKLNRKVNINILHLKAKRRGRIPSNLPLELQGYMIKDLRPPSRRIRIKHSTINIT